VGVSNDVPAEPPAQGRADPDGEQVFGRRSSTGRNLGVITAICIAVAVATGVFASSKSDSDRPSYLNPETPTTSVRLVPAPTIIGQLIPPPSNGPDITIGPRVSGKPSSETTGEDNGLNPLGGDAPEDKLMPDVVCMNLQDAQDEIQDHGVFLSKSEDATGQGRRQAWDRNWIVVSQEPAPGEPIDEREAVLSVVKTDESNDC
jgi:hypothetical protein